MYSQRYSQYLINLEDYLSKDHIALYSSGIASETCRYNKKWVGLVCQILNKKIVKDKILNKK